MAKKIKVVCPCCGHVYTVSKSGAVLNDDAAFFDIKNDAEITEKLKLANIEFGAEGGVKNK